MVDLTTSRNWKDRAARAVDLSRLARAFCLHQAMPALGRISRLARNAGIVLAFFFAAVAVGTTVDILFHPGATKAAMPPPNERIQLARSDALVKEILDRPLFTSDRSPAPQPPSPEELAKLHPPVLKSHLTGITILAETRLALFVADGNKYLSLKEGDDIDGFKVRKIEADRVTLASAFGEQVVRPAKGNYQTVRNTKPVELGNFDPDKH
jgi:hypothetical protein